MPEDYEPKPVSAQRLRTHAILAILASALVIVLSGYAQLGSPAADAAPAPTATVLRVIDGDTLDVRDDDRGRLRVRVLGIDTPEVHRPGWTVGCWGPEAERFATETLTGQRITLTADPTQDANDRYGRTLAYVNLADGRDFSVESVRSGMARSYVYDDKPVSRYPDIRAAEDEARAALRGLWGPPCNGRTESTPT
ncbi:Thermonuclease [Mycolicibacterium vanbaalenii]|uniref:Thermonuclease n=1 Tax=Mycolicibacterium vanbaalenii TaxID=110539 RepID=A0A5S9R3F1_MYCVN|nr:thermonuclease family protein [Mycolicibacterium vanbaalenii]CAA0127300.1 Thermonuclease [Mycolicibacterium vanbaalenii]